MYDFKEFKNNIAEIKDWLKKEYAGLRTGAATPAILDRVTVESYGMKMPIRQLATITTEGSKSLRIVPWDNSQVKTIEKALQTADLGLSVVTDSQGLRVIFPDLTVDRREQLKKVLYQKREQARVSLRTEREKVWEEIQKLEKNSEITEDDKFRLKDEMQAIVDESNKEIDEVTAAKEREIMEK